MRRILAAVIAFGAVATAVLALPAAAAAYPSTTVTFDGHGNGHGRGMGQYGAYGYARNYGWNYQTILSHYYGGTSLQGVGNPTMTVRITGRDGAALGQVTSGRDFTAGGVRVSAGSTATVSWSGSGFVLSTSYGCGQAAVWSTPVSDGSIVTSAYVAGSDRGPLLQVCGGPSYRGNLSLVPAEGSVRTVNTLSMDDYLKGVVPRESPSGWGDAGGQAALDAQAVAARSYSLTQNRYAYAKTCDTQSCQVYGGADLETLQADRAILTTSGQVLVDRAGRAVSAEFSSSTGGWTAGGTFPAVRDEGDAISPFNSWTAEVPVSRVEQTYGVGSLIDIRVTKRNGLGADGGRVSEVQVVGTSRTVTTTGDAMRIALGLRSNWFTPKPNYVGPNFFLATAPGGPVSTSAYFGAPGDIPVSCDWDGDGTDTIGVFRDGKWFIRNSNGTGSPDIIVNFGNPGDQPVCGDFAGTGVDTIGVYRNGWVYLRNSTTSGMADVVYPYGQPGDVAVFGDWDGNRTDTIGIFRAGVWHLSNSTRPSVADGSFGFGAPNDVPVVGDWNGDGYTTTGVVRGGRWFLTNSNLQPTTDQVFGFGNPGDQPVSGRWTGAASDGVGVGRW